MFAKRNSNPSVCIIRHNYYPDSHVRRDAEALARTGHDVHVIALRRPGQAAREIVQGVTVHRLPVEHHRGTVLRYAWEYLSFACLAFLAVARLHLRKRFRVVEVDNMPDLLVFSALVPKLLGAKVILYIFDNMPELLQVIWQVTPRHPLVRILAWMERLSAGFADRVIVSQETARRVVVARGVPEAKVSVVLNSADEAIFHPRPRLVTAHPTGTFEIVTHGAILERYGVQTLIDAVPLLMKQGLDVRVQVFGEGEYGKSLAERARRKGIADRVTFRGFVPQDELLATLSRADLGYVGMLCNLMLSNKLVEYVSLGIPTVVPRWPTFEHYFPDDTVTYYDAGDATSLATAIIAIAAGPEDARARAVRATAVYQAYRWSVQQEAYIGVYEELMARPGMARASQPAD
jgi:glycosyltransferase involved in cell wall biosynthesis